MKHPTPYAVFTLWATGYKSFSMEGDIKLQADAKYLSLQAGVTCYKSKLNWLQLFFSTPLTWWSDNQSYAFVSICGIVLFTLANWHYASFMCIVVHTGMQWGDEMWR